jgi:hypothetical protein
MKKKSEKLVKLFTADPRARSRPELERRRRSDSTPLRRLQGPPGDGPLAAQARSSSLFGQVRQESDQRRRRESTGRGRTNFVFVSWKNVTSFVNFPVSERARPTRNHPRLQGRRPPLQALLLHQEERPIEKGERLYVTDNETKRTSSFNPIN